MVRGLSSPVFEAELLSYFRTAPCLGSCGDLASELVLMCCWRRRLVWFWVRLEMLEFSQSAAELCCGKCLQEFIVGESILRMRLYWIELNWGCRRPGRSPQQRNLEG